MGLRELFSSFSHIVGVDFTLLPATPPFTRHPSIYLPLTYSNLINIQLSYIRDMSAIFIIAIAL